MGNVVVLYGEPGEGCATGLAVACGMNRSEEIDASAALTDMF